MYKISFDAPCHVHMIGIGGISMSGLADILMNNGFAMSGSDRSKTSIVAGLEERGARIAIGQAAENITDDIDVVVYTAAIHPDNPEYAAAAQ